MIATILLSQTPGLKIEYFTCETLFCCNKHYVFLPPANEVWGKVMFLHLCVILFTCGGVCLQGVSIQGEGFYNWGGGSSSSGGSASRSVCIWGGSVSRGFCIQGGSASRGVCIQGGVYLHGGLPPGGQTPQSDITGYGQ